MVIKMEKSLAFLYFIIFVLTFCLYFYILIKTNFEKLFKPNKISEIIIGYILTSFILSTITSYVVVRIVEVIYTLILK